MMRYTNKRSLYFTSEHTLILLYDALRHKCHHSHHKHKSCGLNGHPDSPLLALAHHNSAVSHERLPLAPSTAPVRPVPDKYT